MLTIASVHENDVLSLYLPLLVSGERQFCCNQPRYAANLPNSRLVLLHTKHLTPMQPHDIPTVAGERREIGRFGQVEAHNLRAFAVAYREHEAVIVGQPLRFTNLRPGKRN